MIGRRFGPCPSCGSCACTAAQELRGRACRVAARHAARQTAGGTAQEPTHDNAPTTTARGRRKARTP